MNKTKSFKDLIVWQKAFVLTKEIYAVTRSFPKEETYGLSSQMRRAALSISSNIAEGYGRQTPKEYKQFLTIAYGSLCELETQYLLAVEFQYIKSNAAIESLMKEAGAMLYRMNHPKPDTLNAIR